MNQQIVDADRDAHHAWVERRRREWVDAEKVQAEARDAEDLARTEAHLERQRRMTETQQRLQREWGERLHSLEDRRRALNGAIETATGEAHAALELGDLDGAGLAEAKRVGLESLRLNVEGELAQHRRSG